MVFSEAFHNLQKLRLKRALRKSQTPAEVALWNAIRNRKLNGMKWRRQANVGEFIADFLCVENRLILEVDGEIHAHTQENDRLRTEKINQFDYRVLRFTNDEVLGNIEEVLAQIVQAVG